MGGSRRDIGWRGAVAAGAQARLSVAAAPIQSAGGALCQSGAAVADDVLHFNELA
jgi:hypothetical protein